MESRNKSYLYARAKNTRASIVRSPSRQEYDIN